MQSKKETGAWILGSYLSSSLLLPGSSGQVNKPPTDFFPSKVDKEWLCPLSNVIMNMDKISKKQAPCLATAIRPWRTIMVVIFITPAFLMSLCSHSFFIFYSTQVRGATTHTFISGVKNYHMITCLVLSDTKYQSRVSGITGRFETQKLDS